MSPVATLPLPCGRLVLTHHQALLMNSPTFGPAVQAVSRKVGGLLWSSRIKQLLA